MYKAKAFVCSMLLVLSLSSQNVGHDSILLPTAEIVSHYKTSKGTQILQLDSQLLNENQHQSLANLLQQHSALNIKQYGTTQLSSISIRGASAQQTQVFWSGFNINNTMLGQTDLATIPIASINNAQLILGSQSTAFGSGAIGGVISLNDNTLISRKQNEIDVNLSTAAYNSYHASTKIKGWYKNIITQSAFYYHQSKNDFLYRNRLRPEEGVQKLSHNENYYFGITENLQWQVNSKNFLAINFWWHQQSRNIAPTLVENKSNAKQADTYLKSSIAFTHFFNHSKLAASSAFMQDQLNYENGFQSFSKILSFMNYVNYENNITNSLTWSAKAQVNLMRAVFNNYNTLQTDLIQYQWSTTLEKNIRKKLFLSAAARYEIQNNKSTPLIFQLGTDIHFNQNVIFKWNGGNTYRWPTLNDLFWREGGNINLKPEHGWQTEAGVHFNYKINAFTIDASATGFYRHITDWIIWLPGINFWSPQNIAKVESKGLENKLKLQYTIKQWRINAKYQYDHTLSINKKPRFENDATYNKQLIYTPIQQVYAELGLAYKKTELSFGNKFNGFRYTTADNENYLDGFWVSNFSIQQAICMKKTRATLQLNLNNLGNKNFEYIAYYPMMGFNYNLALTIKIK
jgi:vitamin B12 transporter